MFKILRYLEKKDWLSIFFIVGLVMRFYEVNSGDILIDGVPTKDLTRENVHDLFDMILQDTWVFDGTIRENLVYNKEGVTDKKTRQGVRGSWSYSLYKDFAKRIRYVSSRCQFFVRRSKATTHNRKSHDKRCVTSYS